MSREPSARARVLADLDREIRLMGGRTVMLSQAVASRLNLSSTDLETLDLLSTNGPLTAGRLAELTGLTTGAITGVVDRLEAAGLARRQRDAEDRRRVIVHLIPERARAIGRIYEPLARAMADLNERYTTEQLALMLDYTRRGNAIALEHIERLGRVAGSRERG